MIEGLKIQVGSGELAEHLFERAGYHDEKRAFYERQAGSLREGGVEQQHMSNDPVHSLQTSAKSHAERAAFFQFLADHLVAGEMYRLSEQDLTRIEIVSKYL